MEKQNNEIFEKYCHVIEEIEVLDFALYPSDGNGKLPSQLIFGIKNGYRRPTYEFEEFDKTIFKYPFLFNREYRYFIDLINNQKLYRHLRGSDGTKEDIDLFEEMFNLIEINPVFYRFVDIYQRVSLEKNKMLDYVEQVKKNHKAGNYLDPLERIDS